MDKKIINQICGFQEAYEAFEECWLDFLVKENYQPINFKRKRIKELDISNTAGLETMRYIILYRTYVGQHFTSSTNLYLDSIGINRSRVKEKVSLMQKIRKSINNDLYGDDYIYITRCINDIFGARIIVDKIPNVEEFISELRNAFPKLRVTNANKLTGYKAVHLYTDPNKGSLPWELQIWQAADEENNIKLHAEYKRDYILEIKAIKELLRR